MPPCKKRYQQLVDYGFLTDDDLTYLSDDLCMPLLHALYQRKIVRAFCYRLGIDASYRSRLADFSFFLFSHISVS